MAEVDADKMEARDLLDFDLQSILSDVLSPEQWLIMQVPKLAYAFKVQMVRHSVALSKNIDNDDLERLLSNTIKRLYALSPWVFSKAIRSKTCLCTKYRSRDVSFTLEEEDCKTAPKYISWKTESDACSEDISSRNVDDFQALSTTSTPRVVKRWLHPVPFTPYWGLYDYKTYRLSELPQFERALLPCARVERQIDDHATPFSPACPPGQQLPTSELILNSYYNLSRYYNQSMRSENKK